MDDAALLQRMFAGLRRFYLLFSGSSPGAQVFELDGVQATVVPETPERSIVNGVVYESAGALAGAMDRLTAIYEDAGIKAWMVWVHEADREAAELLEAAGHLLDATPTAMGMELDGFERPDPGDLDWESTADPVTVGRINDLAYGYSNAPFERTLAGAAPDLANLYLACLEHEPVCSVGTIDAQGDCGVYLVATCPEARGRGMAGALMAQAIADGKARGCESSTLQATRMGEPIYARLGYRSLGSLQMWERRVAASG